MSKLIKECRMGPPKSCKSLAVVGTYPTPMLVFLFDAGDLSVIPSKNATGVLPIDYMKVPRVYEDIAFEPPGSMSTILAKPTQPLVTALDYSVLMPMDLDMMYTPTKSTLALEKFQNPGSGDYNVLTNHLRSGKPFPFKTVVFASVTGYMDIVLNHMSSYNPGAMADARNWASHAGGKVRQAILSAVLLPCHVVFIAHTQPPEQDEQTKVLQELPNVYGKLKGVLGGLFSQYFYATKIGNKPIVRFSDYMYVKGVGARWPILSGDVGADFQSIYGKEGLI